MRSNNVKYVYLILYDSDAVALTLAVSEDATYLLSLKGLIPDIVMAKQELAITAHSGSITPIPTKTINCLPSRSLNTDTVLLLGVTHNCDNIENKSCQAMIRTGQNKFHTIVLHGEEGDDLFQMIVEHNGGY